MNWRPASSSLWPLYLGVASILVTFIPLKAGPQKTGLAVALMASSMFLLMYTLLTKVDLPGLADWVRIRQSVGIERLFRRSGGAMKTLTDRIERAHEIRIMAVSGDALIRLTELAITTALIDNRCQVKVLLALSESTFVGEIEALEGDYRTGQISVEIRNTRTRLKEIITSAARQAHARPCPHGRIWLSHYSCALRHSLVICDNEWAWWTPNFPPQRSIDGASFVLRRAPHGLFDDCMRHFDSVWDLYSNKSEEVIP